MSDLIPVVTVDAGRVVANSRDVAAFFGKRHDHVLRDVDALLSDMPPECAPNFGETWAEVPMPRGGTRVERQFLMTRDGFTLLAMGFTGKAALGFKLRYIEAFNAMEQRLKAPQAVDPRKLLEDPAAMRGLLLGYTEKVIQLEERVADLAPKAEAFQRIANADGCYSLRDAAKVLGQAPGAFVEQLIKRRWLYRQPGNKRLSGYQEKVQSGLIRHKAYHYEDKGAQKASQQPMLTARGLTAWARFLGRSEQLGLALTGGAGKGAAA